MKTNPWAQVQGKKRRTRNHEYKVRRTIKRWIRWLFVCSYLKKAGHNERYIVATNRREAWFVRWCRLNNWSPADSTLVDDINS